MKLPERGEWLLKIEVDKEKHYEDVPVRLIQCEENYKQFSTSADKDVNFKIEGSRIIKRLWV